MRDTEQRIHAAAPSGWSELRPQLDAAIAALGSSDRALVVSHFLHGLPQAVAAERLGISENAAQKRLAHALGKMRSWFSRRGVSVGVGLLATGLASEAAAGEPALAAVYAQAALHPSTATAASALASGVIGAGTAKLAAVVVAAGLICAGGAVVATRFLATAPPPAITAPLSATTGASQAATPAQLPRPRETGLLDFTFEDGQHPAPLVDGRILPGPVRDGSRLCVEGVTRPSGDTFKQEVVLAAPEAGLYRHGPGMRLSFDCWISEGPGHLWVTSWDESQKGVLSLELPATAHGAWTRIDIPLDDLRLETDPARAGATGDLMLNLIIKYFGDRDGRLYVDNLRLTKPADW